MKYALVLLVLCLFKPSVQEALDQDFNSRLLNQINTYRALHQVANVTWDLQLANDSSVWAKTCAKKNKLYHDYPMKTFGESLYLCWGPHCIPKNFAERPAKRWHSETRYMNWSNISAQKKTLHLTQMIWKDSTHVGCGYSSVENNKKRIHKYYVVCRYSPPGNWRGEYKQNIFNIHNATLIEE